MTFCYIRFFKGNFGKVILDTVVELIRWHFPIRYCRVFIIFFHVFSMTLEFRVVYTLGSYPPVRFLGEEASVHRLI